MSVKRRGNRVYYYSSIRVGDRVLTPYGGCGPVAESMVLEATATAERRAHHRRDRQAIADDSRRTDEVLKTIDQAARATIEAAGYHRHHRGAWRKRRGEVQAMGKAKAVEVADPEFAVKTRAYQGDKSALPELRELMTAKPQVVEQYGNLSRIVRDEALRRALKTDLLTKEAVIRRMDAIRDELAGPNPTAIERLLADRAALCWVKLHLAELPSTDGQPIQVAEYRSRQVDRLHRQFVSSLKALAQVRKLDLTLIQIAAEKVALVAPGSSRPRHHADESLN